MSTSFRERRRQQFLGAQFYAAAISNMDGLDPDLRASLEGPDGDLENKRGWAFFLSDHAYQRFSLRYTAGEPIEHLRSELTGVVAAYERYQAALSEFEQEKDTAVFFFREIGHYSRLMQLIGLAYLLHRRDLLPRIAKLVDTNFYGADALVEELLDYDLPDRVDTDQMYHPEPYAHLVHAMYREDDGEAIQDVRRHVDTWYRGMKYAPWHDSHLRINGTEGDYFGYWAFEAGAVAYLLDLDDSTIDHMVYPRDLVKWARENRHLTQEHEAPKDASLRCEAGQPCPREGYWFTPAKAGSGRHFKVGEVMPRFSTDWGDTIWQWDQHQEPPQL